MRLLALLATIVFCGSLGFLAASCHVDDEAVSAGPVPSVEAESQARSTSAPGSGPAESASTAKTVPAPPAPGVFTYEVWFHRGEQLFVTHRFQNETRAVGRAALESLLDGPTDGEWNQGVDSEIPYGTRLLGVSVDDGVATVDLSSEFESGGRSASLTMRVAQVVFTLTQFPTVKGVLFELDGRAIDVSSGRGTVLDRPATRKDYEDLRAAIEVYAPALYETVANPVLVSGTANVFEANVTVRILDGNGKEIARTFTTATCGTGCRGRYAVRVPYHVERAEKGTIVVQDDDAAGAGRPPHEVRIPVVLTPTR